VTARFRDRSQVASSSTSLRESPGGAFLIDLTVTSAV